jgi:phospholipid transport system substrate-binding protein
MKGFIVYAEKKRVTVRQVLLVAVCFFVLAGTSLSIAAAGPMDSVKNVVDAILVILQDETLQTPEKKEERRRKVESVVDRSFDFREMAKRSLAKHWRKLSDAERDHFVSLFARLIKQRYITKIDAYSGQQVEYKKEIIKKNQAIVKTVLDNNGTLIPIDYKLRNIDGQWLTFDLKIENVSMVVNYRRDFAGVIKKKKYAGLVATLEKKVSSFNE